jgi:hypothetical protein
MQPHVATCPRPLPEPSAADRKVVLARLLAAAEAERCQLRPSDEEIKWMARWWRSEFGLLDLESFARWLSYSGMDLPRFWAMMEDFAAFTKVLEHYGEQVDARMGDHLAIHSVRAFVGASR